MFSMVDVPVGLKARYAEGRLVPFVGSGVSSSVRWGDAGLVKQGISWRALVDQAATLLGFEEPDLLRERGTDLQILEYFEIRQGSFTGLTTWFNNSMRAPDEALQEAPILKALAGLKRCEFYYTTNFDDFLERGLNLHGRTARAVADELGFSQMLIEDASSSVRSAKVLKFHGDLNHPGAMVLSESDYERRLAFVDVPDIALRADLLGRALLFIGYSFSDWNVAYLFRLFNEQHQKLPESLDGVRGYIAIPDPSDFEKRLFHARNLQVIPIRSSRREEDIADLLKEISDE
jgi:hypothetical protein